MNIKRKIWRKVRNWLPVFGEAFAAPSVKQGLLEREIDALKAEVQRRTPGNSALSGFKVYSQVDEDGIIEEIFRRIGDGQRTFVEIGCGNGTENNTHYLLLKGWKGVWVDGSSDNVDAIGRSIPLDRPSLLVERMFVTRDNIAAVAQKWSARFGSSFDLFSLDIDGNDAAVIEQVLTAVQPRVLVLEYNGKYPPPLKLSVKYDPQHAWQVDEYFGSSLQVFVDLLEGRYVLVSRGFAGANAYFVRVDLASPFMGYTASELFMFARQHLIHRCGAAAPTLKFLRNVLAG